jgi:tetratricopeptide (TPR) repeat protein
MKPHVKLLTLFAIVVSISITAGDIGYGQVVPGRKAPVFELVDVSGERYNLTELESHSMVILYFFDVASRSSQEGLRTLDKLAERYVDTDFKVWAITRSDKDKVREFVSSNRIDFPVLLDTTIVSDVYQANNVLPTICILGPQLRILDYIQGGGKSIEIMLSYIADKELQREQLSLAKGISQEITRINPQNIEAEMIKGYAELKAGDVDAAEKTFRTLSQRDGLAMLVGKEGLVAVHAARGDNDKALKLAAEIEKVAPDRGYVNVVKADIFYSQGKKDEAQTELQKFVKKKSATSYQAAEGLKKTAQLHIEKGDFDKADKIYEQAETIAPHNIEVTVNRGYLYEKEDQWDKALSFYRRALSMDGNVDRAIKKMRSANIAFNVPRSMNLSETIEIILILDLTKSIEELTRMIKRKGKKEGAIIKTTNRMGAELIGSNFQITAISEKIQVITSQNATEWRWAIKPKMPGEHEVYLSLNAYFEVKGRDTPKTIQTFRKTIKIEVTLTKLTKDFFQSNWQWLWTSFFIPITIWLWRKRKKNKDVDKNERAIFE